MKQKAFTLIELLVVLSIIALMASVLLVAVSNTRSKARDARRIADLNQMAKALELYYDQLGYYPYSGSPADPKANYQMMRNALNAAGILKFSVNTKQNFTIFPVAYAGVAQPSPNSDPNLVYEYMSSYDLDGAFVHPKSYKIRTQLELNNSALKNSVPGDFRYDGTATGADACDISLLYYCVGTVGDFAPAP